MSSRERERSTCYGEAARDCTVGVCLCFGAMAWRVSRGLCEQTCDRARRQHAIHCVQIVHVKCVRLKRLSRVRTSDFIFRTTRTFRNACRISHIPCLRENALHLLLASQADVGTAARTVDLTDIAKSVTISMVGREREWTGRFVSPAQIAENDFGFSPRGGMFQTETCQEERHKTRCGYTQLDHHGDTHVLKLLHTLYPFVSFLAPLGYTTHLVQTHAHAHLC